MLWSIHKDRVLSWADALIYSDIQSNLGDFERNSPKGLLAQKVVRSAGRYLTGMLKYCWIHKADRIFGV